MNDEQKKQAEERLRQTMSRVTPSSQKTDSTELYSNTDDIFLLELHFDAEKGIATLRGNKKGLEHVMGTLISLTGENAFEGMHNHFADGSNLSKGNIELIIERTDIPAGD